MVSILKKVRRQGKECDLLDTAAGAGPVIRWFQDLVVNSVRLDSCMKRHIRLRESVLRASDGPVLGCSPERIGHGTRQAGGPEGKGPSGVRLPQSASTVAATSSRRRGGPVREPPVVLRPVRVLAAAVLL